MGICDSEKELGEKMHQFFVTPDQVQGQTIEIQGNDVNHIKNVLRMKEGEELHVSDGNNQRYLCRIEKIEESKVLAAIKEILAEDMELPAKIYLFQGLPKGDKMEWIVQKAVELGVHEIIPVATKRSVVRLDEKKAKKKVERWQMIAESAAKQSARQMIPKVCPVMSYKKALSLAKEMDRFLFPYELAEGMERTREVISTIQSGQSVAVFIGPEGGFDAKEAEDAKEAGAQVITLGKRILRTETAGLTVLSILMFCLEGR